MRRSLPALLALGMACGGSGEPASVRLRLAYEEGDTLRYIYEASGTARLPDTTAAEGYVDRSYERRLTIQEVALDVTPRGNYVLGLVYRLESDELSGGQDLPEAVSFQVELTPQGRVVQVSGVETMKPLFGDIDFKSYFEQAQPVFPERPLKVGDSWTQEVRVVSPSSEPVTTSSTYVLESLSEEEDHPLAVITYQGDIYLPVTRVDADTSAGADSAGAGTAIVIEERIRVEGRIHFDHELGVVERIDTNSEATFSRITMVEGEPVRRDVVIRETSAMRLAEE